MNIQVQGEGAAYMYKDLENRIVETAYRMFKEKGYDHVTVQDICRELQITKPTFYSYIPSKDALLSTFYSRLENDLNEQLIEMVTKDNYWEQILYGFEIILSHSQKFGPDLYSQLFISNLKENKGTFRFIESLTKAMTFLIKRAQEAHQIKNQSDPEKLYMACAKMSFGYGVIWCLENGQEDLLQDFRTGLIQVLQVDPSLL